MIKVGGDLTQEMPPFACVADCRLHVVGVLIGGGGLVISPGPQLDMSPTPIREVSHHRLRINRTATMDDVAVNTPLRCIQRCRSNIVGV